MGETPSAAMSRQLTTGIQQVAHVMLAVRAILTCIFHTLGKKPLIDEWHTPAKAVFSFYDKSLQP